MFATLFASGTKNIGGSKMLIETEVGDIEKLLDYFKHFDLDRRMGIDFKTFYERWERGCYKNGILEWVVD
jgi:hypothetical protein